MYGARRTYWGEKRCIQDFGGETSGMETIFRRPIRAWEDNTEMDLEEISWAWCVLY